MKWDKYEVWPPENVTEKVFYLGDNETLSNASDASFENQFGRITYPWSFTALSWSSLSFIYYLN